MVECIYIHDPEPVPAEVLCPQYQPDPDDETRFIVIGWQPVCAVDAETWYDGSDIDAETIAAHPFPRIIQ